MIEIKSSVAHMKYITAIEVTLYTKHYIWYIYSLLLYKTPIYTLYDSDYHEFLEFKKL
jgi:hypothetical protein